MFCTQCGNKIEDGAVFCTACGVKIEQTFAAENTARTYAEPTGSAYSGVQTGVQTPVKTKERKPVVIVGVIVGAVILAFVAILIGVYNSKTTFNLAVWQGYSSYAAFARAIDADEFLGRPLDEDGFYALMTLAFFAQDDDRYSFDIVSDSKLTERYGVSASLRDNYYYLAKVSPVKGATSYAAYFNGDNWVVLKYKEE